jgi:hypothetical protein
MPTTLPKQKEKNYHDLLEWTTESAYNQSLSATQLPMDTPNAFRRHSKYVSAIETMEDYGYRCPGNSNELSCKIFGDYDKWSNEVSGAGTGPQEWEWLTISL